MKLSAAAVTHHPSLPPLHGAYGAPDCVLSSLTLCNLPSEKTLLLPPNLKCSPNDWVPLLSSALPEGDGDLSLVKEMSRIKRLEGRLGYWLG